MNNTSNILKYYEINLELGTRNLELGIWILDAGNVICDLGSKGYLV
jgi:hypothetical protein